MEGYQKKNSAYWAGNLRGGVNKKYYSKLTKDLINIQSLHMTWLL